MCRTTETSVRTTGPGRRARAAALLALLAFPLGCGREIRNAMPFLPPDKYVDVGGRQLTREERDYGEKMRAVLGQAAVNPKDGVALSTLGEMYHAKGHFEWAKDFLVKATEVDPNLSEPHHHLGMLAIDEDNYKDALIHLNRALKLSPDDARIHHRIGVAHAGLGQAAEAHKAFERALKLDLEYTPAYLDKARLFFKSRRYADAEAACRGALANLPKKAPKPNAADTRGEILKMIWPSGEPEVAPDTSAEEAAFDLALCLKAQGRAREALEALPSFEKNEVTRADIQILRSRLQEDLGDRAGAVGTLEALRKLYPEMAEVPKQLARLYAASGQAGQAAKTRLEAAELDHSDRSLQLEAAQVALASKDKARAIAVYERLVRIDPQDLASLRALARAYDEAGIPRQAALTYQELVNRKADDLPTRRRLGFLYAGLPGFQGRALLQFKQVLDAQPKDAEVHRRVGELYLAARNLPEAETHLREALDLNPRDALAHARMGDLYAAQKRGEDAAYEFRKALELKPTLVAMHLALAKVLLMVDRREDAIKPMETYLKTNPDDQEARRLYADTLRDLNRRELAAKQYETLAVQRPKDTGSVMELAKLATLLGQRTEAAGMYESLLEKNPADVEALRSAARLYGELKQPLRAMYCWQRLLKLAAHDQEAQSSLAATYKSIGDDEAALQVYENLGQAEAWRNAAFLRLKRGEKEKAILAYRKVIELNKTEVEARAALAALLQRSPQDEPREEALKLYQELLKLDEKDLRARLNMANLFCEQNRWAEAQEQYETILREQPAHAGAQVGLGAIFRKRNKLKEAQEQYEGALKADPDCKLAHYNLAVLYDYYLENPAQAREHYEAFVRLGGDAKLLPKDGPEVRKDLGVLPSKEKLPPATTVDLEPNSVSRTQPAK